jgi:serine protease Do
MQETIMLDAIERYVRGEMLSEERAFFEELRKSNPAVDQMVVEHTLFLQEMTAYGEKKDFRTQLIEVHKGLVRDGEISEATPGKMVFLWRKYKRVVWVAASIAGITALFISGLVTYVSPKVVDGSLQQLRRRITDQDKKLNQLNNRVNQGSALPEEPRFTSGGTGFLIDAKGYLVTNAHVVKNATLVEVQNKKGEYSARIIHLDLTADLAFLKIEDSTFKPSATLPYSISKGGTDLAEEIFTLGYPRDEIVYGQGYMSAKTGYEGDTLACQVAVAANPGNSGGPVLNKNGEVIGILSTRESKSQGVVFAIRSKNIFRAVDEMKTDSTLLKTDSTLSHLRLPVSSSIKGMERTQQVKKIEDCIFFVKSNLSN